MAAQRSGPQAERKPPVTFRYVAMGRSSRSLPLLSGGGSGGSRKVNRPSRIRLQSKWRHRDDVTDDHLVVREDHPVHDQPQDLLPDLERRIDQRVANARPEALEPLQQPDLPLPLRAVAADLVEPLPQMPAIVLD